MRKKYGIFLFIFVLMFSCSFIAVANPQKTSTEDSGELPYKSYTYWEDYGSSEKTAAYVKPAFKVDKSVSADELGADENSKLVDVAADKNGNTYILDSAKSCVYILDCEYKLTLTLNNLVYRDKAISFAGAQGIYVDKTGSIYIADTENARVIVTDKTGIVNKLLLIPESKLVPTNFKYRPVKVAVDSNGYTYIASDGSYFGAILYSPEMEFLGFFGANTVKTRIVDTLTNLWEKITSNDIKRAADELSIPYTFTDIVVGDNDLVYTATGKGDAEEEQTGQICVLNPGGKSIIDTQNINFADIVTSKTNAQDLSRIAVDGSGFFFALDTVRGRIYWYDSQCTLLSVFGGNQDTDFQVGTYEIPTAVAVNGTDVIVSAAQKNTLTVFKMTEYGKLLNEAQKKTNDGDYVDAMPLWEKVAASDGNSQLAYSGLAKAYYELGENIKAMDYSKLGMDRETYSEAFTVVRTEWAEKWFGLLFFTALFFVGVIAGFAIYRKKHEFVLIKNQKVRTAISSVAHPVESFRLVKEQHMGSIVVSIVLLSVFYFVTVMNDTMSGFMFTNFSSEKYNAFYVFLSTVGLILLFVISNWLVCTLFGGIGKLNEIFIVSSYSLIPLIFAKLCNLVLTHLLTPDEGAFLGIFTTVFTLYAAFMLIVGLMRIHDYEFKKFVGTTVFTVVAMMIIVFLIFLIFLISQQLFGWFGTLYVELRYR